MPTFTGTVGNDLLVGTLAADTIIGSDGDDRITGSLGIDALYGGAGVDLFIDTAAGFNGDTIYDFSTEDRLLILDANIGFFNFSLSGSILNFNGNSLTLLGVRGTLTASAANGGGVELRLAPPTTVQNDFNGDGRSDILWRHSSGEVGQWLGQRDGAFVNNGRVAPNPVDPNWFVAGIGDFNGDGRADVFWRHSSGALGEWQGQPSGQFVNISSAVPGVVDSSWRVVGVSDYNGDGREDILWRHTSGVITEWLGRSDGSFFNNTGAPANTVDNGWTVVASGDFNGDGYGDIVWRHTSGVFAEWQGSRTGNFTNTGTVLSGASGTIVGTGDFNGDGFDDLISRASNGAITEWFGQASGQFLSFSPSLQVLDTNWRIAEIGDFDGDGRDDLVWRHSSGANTQWQALGNGEFANIGGMPTVDPSWTIQSPDGIFF